MAEETKAVDTNTKTQLSLAAALFFSPLVQNLLKKSKWDITEKDKEFIRGYIKFGYITLLFWIIAVATGVMEYLFPIKILSVTYTISIFILIFLLIISIVSILSDISLIKWGDIALETYTIEGNKKDIIFTYLPLYNIYLRYEAHSFEKPNRRIKESILRRIIFILGCLIGNITISSVTLIIIILRIAALMSDIDFFTILTKQQLNKLFFKNPEELRGYITGFLTYMGKSFIHIFMDIQPYTIAWEIAREKEAYSRIIGIQGNISIIIEYLIWIALVFCFFIFTTIDFTVRTYYAGFWLLIARYLIMAIQLKHVPHLPIAREIMLLAKSIAGLFTKRSFIQNQ